MAGDWRNTQGCVIFVNQMLGLAWEIHIQKPYIEMN